MEMNKQIPKGDIIKNMYIHYIISSSLTVLQNPRVNKDERPVWVTCMCGDTQSGMKGREKDWQCRGTRMSMTLQQIYRTPNLVTVKKVTDISFKFFTLAFSLQCDSLAFYHWKGRSVWSAQKQGKHSFCFFAPRNNMAKKVVVFAVK